MSKYSSNDQKFIRDLTDLILSKLEDENFGVKELVLASAMSHYKLSERVQAITNRTISQFIRETRLQKAFEILQNEDITAAEVAYKVGFRSPAYFNKCFHEFFGYPPGKVSIGESANFREINSLQITTNQVQIKPLRSTNILVLSVILVPVILVFLIYIIVLKNFSSNAGNSVKKPDKSLAVLPFKNLGDTITNQYFLDGVMEEMLSNLSRIHDLRVISRTSVEQFRESKVSVTEIAKKLNVDYVVEGSGQKYGNIFRLRVQLIDASNDRHIWAESYEKVINEIKDIFSIQSQIAQAIASELKARITPEEKQLIDKTPTLSLSAYDFYRRGKEELMRYGFSDINRESVERAEALFHAALEYDSAYAQAYAGLATVSWKKYYLEKYSLTYLDSMLIFSDIALSYDDKLTEAFNVRAGYYDIKGNNRKVVEECNKAIRYDPNDWNSYWSKGVIYEDLDLVQSFENLEKAASLNHGPQFIPLLTRIGYDYYQAGFPEKGNEYLREVLKLDMDSVKYLDKLIRYEAETQGDYKKAIAYFTKRSLPDSANPSILLYLGYFNAFDCNYKESLKYYNKYFSLLKSYEPSNPWTGQMMEYLIGYTYLQNGYRKEAYYYFDKQIKTYNDRLKYPLRLGEKIYFIYPLAGVYASKGDNRNVYKSLNIFNQYKCIYLVWLTSLKNDPVFSSIRNEPEFQQIVRDVEAKYQAEHERVKKWLEEQGKP
jgi:TolB-like protein/AraC-like DNA-binding protein